jgi:hypothetical protein
VLPHPARFHLFEEFREGPSVFNVLHTPLGNFVSGGRAAKHSGDAIVVFKSDGIKLVIMAANASHRHPHKRGADLNDLRINVVCLHSEFVGIDDFNVADEEKTCGDDVVPLLLNGLMARGSPAICSWINRSKGLSELKAHDVVTVAPCMFREDPVGGADHVGVTGEVEPVA